MTAIELIDETVEYYSQDTSRRAVDEDDFCSYKKKGKMCAVGRCILKKQNTKLTGSAKNINRCGKMINLEDILKTKYKGFPMDLWMDLQAIHDVSRYWDADGLSEFGKDRVEQAKERWKDQ